MLKGAACWQLAVLVLPQIFYDKSEQRIGRSIGKKNPGKADWVVTEKRNGASQPDQNHDFGFGKEHSWHG